MIWLENYFNLIFTCSFNCGCTWDQSERSQLLFVFYSWDLRNKTECYWETWDIFYAKAFFNPFISQNVSETKKSIIQTCNFNFRSNTYTFKINWDNCVIWLYLEFFFKYLLRIWLKLDYNRPCLSWFDSSHGIKDAEATKRC